MSQGAGNSKAACDDCRKKKKKCSGEKPKCRSCAPFSSPCIYSERRSIPRRKEKILKNSVESRLRFLENKISILESAGHEGQHSFSDEGPRGLENDNRRADTALHTQVGKFHTIHSPDASYSTVASSPTAAAQDLKEFTPPATSLEEQRRQRAKSYDPSVLDAWLQKQSHPEKLSQPSPDQLLKTQRWGHIDPRTEWPEEPSDEWLDEKRKEIEARGGRKANFGKLLTAQVITERSKNAFHDKEPEIVSSELYLLDKRI